MRFAPFAVPMFVFFSLSGCGGGAESGAGSQNLGGNGGGTATATNNGGGGNGGTSTSDGGGGTSSSGGGGATGGTGGGGSGGGSACDQAGECGNTGNDGCVACAVNGPCSDVFDACFTNDSCAAYQTCLAFCDGNTGCIEGCNQEVPAGKIAYDAYEQCVLCDQCVVSCNSANICGN